MPVEVIGVGIATIDVIHEVAVYPEGKLGQKCVCLTLTRPLTLVV
jgi:hypothetical protein